MTIRPGIELAGLTYIGCHRENNEDNYAYWEPEQVEDFDNKGRLLLVADGMGGYEGGQEASRLAVETIQSEYAGSRDASPVTALRSAFESAHQRIQDEAARFPEFHGMGTTCTA